MHAFLDFRVGFQKNKQIFIFYRFPPSTIDDTTTSLQKICPICVLGIFVISLNSHVVSYLLQTFPLLAVIPRTCYAGVQNAADYGISGGRSRVKRVAEFNVVYLDALTWHTYLKHICRYVLHVESEITSITNCTEKSF